ncbi:PREDICTED: type I inositol 3,4-bisphosphate 4-phosphatase-like isoform X1 [Branchiostoma belcheri]|uniref:Inositol polyphosphate-4-phosphatase type I A n=2 Tax=Branchiostoma belcheri TaxID=7741 RepID=A0A6P4YIF6_BRABE|nr:PREDICTED: type I inositol 3,4-bisphosphate 4-phosphatase-like isoform X1 [Branchiostoma belcheri]
MRYNARELMLIASEKPSYFFDKEGLLIFREREHFWKNKAVNVERWCRLKGNLLFYMKSKDKFSSPLGVFVLERCTVSCSTFPNPELSFKIQFELDPQVQYLTTHSQEDRDTWLAALQNSSIEALRGRFESLRGTIMAKTGQDPVPGPEPPGLLNVNEPAERLGIHLHPDEPILELSLACSELITPRDDRRPNSYVQVSYVTPPGGFWTKHSQTEIIEATSTPLFMTTVVFTAGSRLTVNTRVKLSVWDVKDRATSTMYEIGSAMFPVKDILHADDHRLHLPLKSSEGNTVGYITILSWELSEKTPLPISRSPSPSNKRVLAVDESLFEPVSSNAKYCSLSRDVVLKALYESTTTKTYRFPTTSGSTLSVQEFMAETKLSFHIPIQLLKILIDEEKQQVVELEDLGKLTPHWEQVRKSLLDHHLHLVHEYTEALHGLQTYRGPAFKASCLKEDKRFEFVPLNLHLQRMRVQLLEEEIDNVYDIVTVGAMAAHTQGFKQGGLKKLLASHEDVYSPKGSGSGSSPGQSHSAKARDLLSSIQALKTQIMYYSESLMRSAKDLAPGDMRRALDSLTDKTRQLVTVCEDRLLDYAIHSLKAARPDYIATTPNDEGDSVTLTTGTEDDPTAKWTWEGDSFKPKSSQSSWEDTLMNVDKSLDCIIKKVDQMTQQEPPANLINRTPKKGRKTSEWSEALYPLQQTLTQCVTLLTEKVQQSLTFLLLQDTNLDCWLETPKKKRLTVYKMDQSETSESDEATSEMETSCVSSKLQELQNRRDIVFSQALSAVVAGFITKLRTSLNDENFLRQLYLVGLLVHYESLLSPHADELGMLEDMVVGINDLRNVTFKIVPASSTSTHDLLPVLTGTRTGINVRIPLPPGLYGLLPAEIRSGMLLRIQPVLFTVGINEKATLAEKFGNTSLQEIVNIENFSRLNSYYEQYMEMMPAPADVDQPHQTRLAGLLQFLQNNVHIRKSKNVEILQQSAEICRRLNGVRVTGCKSAKDRTAMSVTLEQCTVLQLEHMMAPQIFNNALDCMRSEGCRRENTMKNIGSRKYAFHSLQLMAFPKNYRPPEGTYGNVAT